MRADQGFGWTVKNPALLRVTVDQDPPLRNLEQGIGNRLQDTGHPSVLLSRFGDILDNGKETEKLAPFGAARDVGFIHIGLVDRADRQLQDEIINARRRYDDAFTKPLRRRGATPRRLVQRTTSDGLLVEAVVADGGQLAAWGAPPPRAEAPMSTRLHQTAVNNLLDSFLAGATIARDSVDEPPTIDVVRPEWLKLEAEPPAPGEEFQPWSIALRDPRPVSVEFVEGSVTAIVHAAEIQAEGKSYRGWDLITTYEPQRVDGRWRLVRRGDIDVLPTRFDPASGDSLGSGDVGLRNNLVKVLNENGGRFPQAIDVDPVDLTRRRGPVRYLSLRDIRFVEGWAAAGWRAL